MRTALGAWHHRRLMGRHEGPVVVLGAVLLVVVLLLEPTD